MAVHSVAVTVGRLGSNLAVRSAVRSVDRMVECWAGQMDEKSVVRKEQQTVV